MIMVPETARSLKRFISKTGLAEFAQTMMLRMIVTFALHHGRMTCSQAAGSLTTAPVHRSQVTRFLARPRWQRHDFNAPLRAVMLDLESVKGRFLFIIDATLASQAGLKTQNTFSTGNRKRRPKKGRRYDKKKVQRKQCHSFTFGLLITPSGFRIPFQIPHYTKEYCQQRGIEHRTTAESAADLIRQLPLPEGADVVVLGDTAYESKVVQQACEDRNYIWICPANPERVYEEPDMEGAKRPKLRSRLKDWTSLSLKTIRLRASTGKYAKYRRLSQWRVGPRQKPRVYYAYQEMREVRNVGNVQLAFSTMKPDLKKATPDDVKILLTNATTMSVTEVIELYSLRWQIELFFKELKSTLGFSQYSFQDFRAVEAWVNIAITTVLYLEYQRARKMQDRRLSAERREWWRRQRLHGLCMAFRQECEAEEINYIQARLQTNGGIQKLKRMLKLAKPYEYRLTA